METSEQALTLIEKGMFMVFIDLTNAYFGVPIAEEHLIYLRFGMELQIISIDMFNGLAFSKFSKLMKPVCSSLRKMGHINSGFIDDSLICGAIYEECVSNVTDTKTLMTKVSFIINHENQSSSRLPQ